MRDHTTRGYTNPMFLLAVFGVAVLLVLGIGSSIYIRIHHHEKYGCTVVSKDHAYANGNSLYRVYTDNCGNFAISDSALNGNFHSSDTYARIQVGKTYDFDTIGYRVPLFSMFPNILSATEVSK